MNDEILHRVKRPARYLGRELHAVRAPGKGDLRVALAFPDLYEVGMSHLGVAILYHCLNRAPGIFAERVYMPDEDLEQILRGGEVPLSTLETRTPLHRLDVLGFSLAYELTYTNVLAMLDLGGIPLRSNDRRRRDPLVIAGGPCVFNPEPLARFIDAFVIGDAEYRAVEVCRLVAEWKESGDPREELLRALDRMEGLYVPSLFDWRPGSGGTGRRLVSLTGRNRPVRKCEVLDLDVAPYPDRPLVPFARIVHDRISIEAARGCPHACRFCQAGNLYRPYRERSPERLTELALKSLERTGYEELSLLALSIGDYASIGPLVGSLMRHLEPRKISFSLPSLRVGSLPASVAEEILRVRKTGFTLAPEAASGRLRGVINKDIPEEEIFRTAHLVSRLGWRALKLYFMIGLPTETDQDVEGIVRLARRVRKIAKQAGRGGFQVTVNISSFVPKPHTPFQWCAQASRSTSEEKQRFLRRHLRAPGFRLRWHDARLSLLEGVFARGDRETADLLEAAYRLGCRRDAWSEHFRYDLWERAMEDCGMDVEGRLDPYPEPTSPLPWDWIETGMPRSWFAREYQKAMEGVATRFLCTGDCGACRICDRPVPGNPEPGAARPPPAELHRGPARPGGARRARKASRFRLTYEKRHPASCLGHLETIGAFYRALRRSGLPLHFTSGEHPHPKASFSPALSLGIESMAEHVDLWLSEALDPSEVRERLNAVLPEGLRVLEARPVALKAPSLEESIAWVDYEITFPEGEARSPNPEEMVRAVEAFYRRGPDPGPGGGKEGRTRDLRPFLRLRVSEDGDALFCRVHRVSGSLPSAVHVIESLFPDLVRDGLRPRILKREVAFVAPRFVSQSTRGKVLHDQ